MARLMAGLLVTLVVILATRAEAGVTKRVKFQPGEAGWGIRCTWR